MLQKSKNLKEIHGIYWYRKMHVGIPVNAFYTHNASSRVSFDWKTFFSDYLQNAECIKEKATTEVYCGRHYSSLVNMVKGVTPSTQRELCCSHSTFKSCVLHETRACRGQGGSGQMLAQDFARAMLDKSLGFLLNQCQVRFTIWGIFSEKHIICNLLQLHSCLSLVVFI